MFCKPQELYFNLEIEFFIYIFGEQNRASGLVYQHPMVNQPKNDFGGFWDITFEIFMSRTVLNTFH